MQASVLSHILAKHSTECGPVYEWQSLGKTVNKIETLKFCFPFVFCYCNGSFIARPNHQSSVQCIKKTRNFIIFKSLSSQKLNIFRIHNTYLTVYSTTDKFDVLRGRLLGNHNDFHWQLGGQINHQPCSYKAARVIRCTELDSAVSSF